ncbi:MAG: hypothetical protein KTR25_20300 [Myxococcales bacterium]|nr:hypothetical protein [Myxococcales bacterium]
MKQWLDLRDNGFVFMIRALLRALFGSFGPFTIGIGMFILMVIYFPSGVRAVQRWAQTVENSVDFENLPDSAAVLANMMIDDSSITMLVFVVGAKFMFSLVSELFLPSSRSGKTRVPATKSPS